MGDKPLVRDSADSGMVPLFNLVNSFVDGLFPKTLGDIIEENDITRVSELGDVKWGEWALMALGLVVCVLVGAIFIVIFPFCGCCYCCCGCCQPEKKLKAKKPSKCKEYTCTGILFVLIATMFAMVICSFVANSMVENEFGEEGMLNDLKIGFDLIEEYLHQSVDDIDEAVFPPLNQTIDEVFLILEQLPETTVQKFAKETGIDPALYILNDYAQNIAPLNENLTVMQDTTEALKTAVVNMDAELTTVRGDLEPLLDACITNGENSKTDCETLKDELADLTSDAQYDHLDDLTLAIAATGEALDNNIPDIIAAFVANFTGIVTSIEKEVADDINELQKAVKDAQVNIENKFDEFSDTVNNVTFDEFKDKIDEVQPDVEKYGSWATSVFYVISALCLLPAIWYLIGIPMGVAGGPKSAKHASNCLMAAIAFLFIFGCFFMLVTMAAFIVGGTSQGVVCRHATDYDETMQSLEKIIRAEKNATDPYNLTIRQLIDSCIEDEALYTAFRLAENVYNVSEKLDLENTQLPVYIEQLKNTTIDIGTIVIINDQVNQSILAIEALTSNIDFTEYATEVKKPVTKTHVLEYAAELDDVATKIESEGDTALADSIRAEAQELRDIDTNHIVPMEVQRATLASATENANTIVTSVSLSKVMYNLTIAQEILNTQSDEMIQDIIGVTADDIYKILDDLSKSLLSSIENDIAGCRPVYDALTTVVYGPCVYFLYPFNALWFSYGWYVAFGFLSIFFATSVVGMFRFKGHAVNKVSPAVGVNTEMALLNVNMQPPAKPVPEPEPDYMGAGQQWDPQVNQKPAYISNQEPPPDYDRPPSAQSNTLSEKMNSSTLKLATEFP